MKLALVLAVALAGTWSVTKIDWRQGLSRDAFSQPQRVLAALAIEPGARVADLGAGDGYFSFRLAAAMGEGGRVYTVEVSEGALRRLRERARAGGHTNVEVIEGALDDPRLPDGAIDLVLLSDVYHHLDDRVAYLARLRTDLVPGGRVAILEPRASWASWWLLLPPGHGVAVPVIREEMAAAGYRHLSSHDFLPAHSFEVFAAPR